MTRTGGERTRKKIMAAAEELFSKNGFHATTIKQITREAGVNQGLVYYYFKDKNDIVISLFKDIVEDLSGPKSRWSGAPPDGGAADLREALKEEMSFLDGRRKIISVMLMEGLKTGDRDTFLFQCADLVMSDHAHQAPKTKSELVHEFFTGFIPLVAFVALQEKFCEYFHCDKKEALDLFVDSFMTSHVNTHPRQEVHRGK